MDHQRVHPMDVESSGPPYNPKYVMLNEDQAGVRPPPYRRNVPRYHSTPHKKKGNNCCLKCICCFYCFLFFLIFALSIAAFYLYTFFQPQIPKYSVEHLEIGTFDVQVDFSLYTEFIVTVKAENPNEKISIIYEEDSGVLVSYSGSTLCAGKLPSFHQGYKNTTIMKVVLKGKSEYGSGLQEAMSDNKHTGRIPLNIRVTVPVTVELADFPLRQFTVYVNCSLVVDNLQPKKKVGILSSKYDVKVQF